MAAKGTIEQFIENAQRRHWTNLALEYLGIAAAFGAGGVILLLLLGTQILDWYWPLALFVLSLVAGLILARRRRLSTYRVAQLVDARLGLKDRLATVIFFRDHTCSSQECLDTVERQANERLAGEDIRQAVPITVPRHAYIGLALLGAAAGLVGVRYGILRTLDLGAPLARIDFSGFQEPANVMAATKKSVIKERLEEQLKQLGLNVEDNMAPDQPPLEGIEANVPAVAEPGGDLKAPDGKRTGSTPQSQEDGEGAEKGEKSAGDGADVGDAAAGDKAEKGQNQNPPKDPKQNTKGGQEGLMDKMKDALANLMNKMKSATKSDLQQSASLNQSSKPNGKQQSNEQGTASREKSNGEGQPSPDQQGQEGPGEKSPGDQSRAGDRSAEKPGNQDSKTGMGKQDGAKDIKDAEQMAAMGKISEIFGKRAQQITGEMTVEVSSSKQQLKTAYSSQRTTHADTGAEVNRDEIPLAYQSYIQRYFEEVRKNAPAKPSAAKPGETAR